ncbi:TPA: hypothetical protein QCX24_001331 [Bacillus toyonensis]|uniref:hypothetical protein n=1 Tax=Bacillus TaxID=1386 RepID=UPI001144A087|nr:MULTISPECIES: hypothetical protein [Bacillus]MCU5091959.1 hypothetical protein [Bacillus toyonensis]MDF9887037.1 hypothetical protein [Bacillus sp. LEw-kw-24]MED3485242.1 hypothetical protein [Bacillus toyonensis]HDR7382153.1 hypothetical protein [Bacillus toyonensis]
MKNVLTLFTDSYPYLLMPRFGLTALTAKSQSYAPRQKIVETYNWLIITSVFNLLKYNNNRQFI